MTKTNDKVMNFLDIASIVFICTAANHIGPIPDIERFIGRKLPVVGCIKCLTFWSVLVYCCGKTATHSITTMLAISFLSAWASIWLELFMGIIDHLYIIIYDTLYPTADETDADEIGAADSVPDVPEEGGCRDTATNRAGGQENES